MFTHELKWVGCQFPTPALAQEAGLSFHEFEDFLYGACLLDWDAERERMSRYAQHFDEAEEVRIVGSGTNVRLGVAGRPALVDAGGANMPGGEFFLSPVEDSAEGEIVFGEFPAVYNGREVTGITLRFEAGRVVDASATANEEFLVEMLDLDDGARRLGELGIGCNPGITRYMKNTLRREDRRHRPSCARERLARGRWHEREPAPLGYRQGSPPGRQDRAGRPNRPGGRPLAGVDGLLP